MLEQGAGLRIPYTHAGDGFRDGIVDEILGFGGTLAVMSRLLDATALPPSLLGPVIVYAAVWVFLSGGILDRVARARPVRTSATRAVVAIATREDAPGVTGGPKAARRTPRRRLGSSE